MKTFEVSSARPQSAPCSMTSEPRPVATSALSKAHLTDLILTWNGAGVPYGGELSTAATRQRPAVRRLPSS